MINMYMYVCICICMYSTYIFCLPAFYKRATYTFIYSSNLLPIHCLYTTYTTWPKIDKTLPLYYIQYHIAPMYHLFRCTNYYIFPIQHMQPPSHPSHPNPHPQGGWGIPWRWVGGRRGTQNLEHIHIHIERGCIQHVQICTNMYNCIIV